MALRFAATRTVQRRRKADTATIGRSPISARATEIPAYRARLEASLDGDVLERLVAEGAAISTDEALASVVKWAEARS